ncbi:LysM peptidoglycan-binding domain-containing protein [Alicyclobacillus macrosporangiidus]|uniref:LysM domain-containing protein n=1 Tax=Alicyclobacillus macrosporangiidus TaxID=392015 RepID=A0A1I7IBZ8_9BACL|nr:LysM peptidoglycan-binding domain-containing protein [Alicyclobacillus macrosporangiidus]SFU70418.1 LysM domain-containing protein [Alicyclobacillus macrosporangiidus]
MTIPSPESRWRSTTPTSRSDAGRHRGLRKAAPLLLALVWVLMFLGAAMASVRSGAVSPGPKTTLYTVQPGDTLWSIASRLDKHQDPRQAVWDIMQANGLKDSLIRPGMVLQIPAGR